MSEWKKVKLGDCCLKIGSGSTPKGGSTVYVESGTSFIRSQNVYNLSFDYNGLTHITEDAANKLNGVTIFNDDILLNITGDSVARTCIVPNDVLPARVNQHVAIVRADCKMINSRFLNYYLASPGMQAHMLSLAVGKGASRNAMTKQMIENFEVPCPSLSTQHRIATILSRYDSLIENYQKQIKLLEEAAQRLYKEWFVDLHFPGHENTKIVDGVPEGWTPSLLGQLAEFKRGKTITKKDAVEGDIPVVAGGLEPAYYCNKSNTAERVITVSGSGANAGFTRMYFENVWASDCSFVDASTTPFLHFVFCYLKDNKTKIDNMQKGAAQPHVYAKDINSLGICIPIESVLKSFEGKVSKYFDSISSLQSQIRLLTEARDRLLPKLMNGEITT
ncbi:MAG: restriction endonuclease subunit S [Prevotella sp.]|nr:restriction endonuclease subunit S [Prevotella sp.]